MAEGIAENTTMDIGQANAFVSALTREVALIQGPPGTGKSYVGIQLARCLLHNFDTLGLGAILCVCYTNHALEQFLSALMDAGVKDIMRLGGHSPDPRMESICIENFKKSRDRPRIFQQGRRIGESRSKLEMLSVQISELSAEWECDDHHVVVNYLQKRVPALARKILPNGGGARVLKKWLSRGAQGKETTSEPPIEQLLDSNMQTLTRSQRRHIFGFLQERARDHLSQKLHALLKAHAEEKQRHTSLFQQNDGLLLKNYRVVGATTTGLANNAEILRDFRAEVLICEEAAEVLESHVLTAFLPSVQHAILIGDHLQLRPRISNMRLSMEYDEGLPKYNLDESLFERLANSRFTTYPSKARARFP
ncbi:hypothetical protein KEM55_006259, partial [Ascosphaera atra]